MNAKSMTHLKINDPFLKVGHMPSVIAVVRVQMFQCYSMIGLMLVDKLPNSSDKCCGHPLQMAGIFKCPVLSFPVPENGWPTVCVTQICHIYPIMFSVQEECTPNHSSQFPLLSGCHQVACCRCKPCFNIMFFQIKCGNHHARSFGRMVR